MTIPRATGLSLHCENVCSMKVKVSKGRSAFQVQWNLIMYCKVYWHKANMREKWEITEDIWYSIKVWFLGTPMTRHTRFSFWMIHICKNSRNSFWNCFFSERIRILCIDALCICPLGMWKAVIKKIETKTKTRNCEAIKQSSHWCIA